jgi:hypothetical protein
MKARIKHDFSYYGINIVEKGREVFVSPVEGELLDSLPACQNIDAVYKKYYNTCIQVMPGVWVNVIVNEYFLEIL